MYSQQQQQQQQEQQQQQQGQPPPPQPLEPGQQQYPGGQPPPPPPGQYPDATNNNVPQVYGGYYMSANGSQQHQPAHPHALTSYQMYGSPAMQGYPTPYYPQQQNQMQFNQQRSYPHQQGMQQTMTPGGGVQSYYYYDANNQLMVMHHQPTGGPPPQMQMQMPSPNPIAMQMPMQHPAASVSSPRPPKTPRSPPTANGVRMNAFVFPQQRAGGGERGATAVSHPQQHQSNQPSVASSTGSAAGGGGMRSLPAKPASASRATNLVLGRELLDNLPALPPLPPMPSDDGGGGGGGGGGDDQPSPSSSSPSPYTSALLDVIAAYKAREEAMEYRVQALAFRPEEAWKAMQQQQRDGEVETEAASNSPIASVVGVRLLRRVDVLQRENDELGAELSRRIARGDGGDDKEEEVEGLKSELQDAHTLISHLSDALQEAEEKAAKAQRTLQLAVDSKSVGFG